MSPVSADTESGVTNSAPAAGQDGAHRDPAFRKPPDQIKGFVGGDAAADDEKNALALDCHADSLNNSFPPEFLANYEQKV